MFGKDKDTTKSKAEENKKAQGECGMVSTQLFRSDSEVLPLYRQMQQMRDELRHMRRSLELLTQALGFEVYSTDFVPAQESKVDIRKKAK